MPANTQATSAFPVITAIIADDSVIMRSHLANMLAEIGGIEVVYQVGSAERAVEAVRRLRPGLAILDVQMPGGGLNALKAIKALSHAPTVVMLTAFAAPRVRAASLEAGADHFFDKTSEMERFLDLLRMMVEQVRSQARLGRGE